MVLDKMRAQENKGKYVSALCPGVFCLERPVRGPRRIQASEDICLQTI